LAETEILYSDVVDIDIFDKIPVARIECDTALIVYLRLSMVEDVDVGDCDSGHGFWVIGIPVGANNNGMCYICPQARILNRDIAGISIVVIALFYGQYNEFNNRENIYF
jgi:hypothetical protein